MYEDDFQMNEAEIETFGKILANMKTLIDISLSNNVSQKFFLSEDFNNSVKFRLQKIYVMVNAPPHRSHPKAPEEVYSHLMNFLNNQRSSLKDINLVSATITSDRLEFLLSLQLTKLALVQTEYMYNRNVYVTNSTIENLFLSVNEGVEEESDEERMLCDLLKNCTETKKIRFVCTDITFEMCIIMAHRMKKLHELSLYQSDMFAMHLPTMKKLVIDGGDHDESIRLIRLNRQLKQLKVPPCFQHHPKFSGAIDELNIEELSFN